MEWVNHVHIIEVGSCSLIGDVYRMFQREIPYRESLKLGVTRTHPTLVLVIKLTQADSHLAATRTRSSNDDQRTLGLHIIILAESLV